MVFTNIQPFPMQMSPLSNVTPFTYRDGMTFLEKLELMRVWLNSSLVPETDAAIANAIDEFQTGIKNAEQTVLTAKAGWQATYDSWTTERKAEYDALVASINANQEAYKELMNGNFTSFTTSANANYTKFVSDIEALVDLINNKSGPVDIQRATLTGDYTLAIDPLWPTNQPVSFSLTQDGTGNHAVLNSADIVGSLDLNHRPYAVTEFQLIPRGDGKWKIVQLARTLPFVIVEDYRLDTDPDDTASVQRAINSAIRYGKPRVIAKKQNYTMSAGIDCTGATGLTFEGLGRGVTRFNFASTTQVRIPAGFYSSGNASDLIFRDFTITGTTVDDVTEPRLSRTETSVGIESGFIFKGDLNPGNGSTAVIRNVTITRVDIEKNHGLPFQFDGVRGDSTAYDVKTYLTMDGGWVFCEHVRYDLLKSYKSADNGFSISRGNQRVTGGSIYAEMCANYAAWFAGFYINGTTANETGPVNFTAESVHAVNCGMGAVNLDNGPKNGKIGSVFANGIRRGPVDNPTDAGGSAVLIGGYPSNNRNAPTVYAENITIDSVDTVDCARGAVTITAGSKNVKVKTVTSINTGSQYASNGTSAIGSGDTENNYGVGVPSAYAATVSDVTLGDVTFIDTRATAYGNYAVSAPSSVSRMVTGNVLTRGARQGMPSTRTLTVTAGAQASTATAAGNGAYRHRGTLNCTTTAAPTDGSLVTVSFGNTPFSSTPNVTITPVNLESAKCQPYVTNRSSTGFTIAAGIAPTANAALSYDYHVTG